MSQCLQICKQGSNALIFFYSSLPLVHAFLRVALRSAARRELVGRVSELGSKKSCANNSSVIPVALTFFCVDLGLYLVHVVRPVRPVD